MKSWKSYRSEFYLMALGEADEATREKLLAMISQDPECRTFWEEIKSLCEKLQTDNHCWNHAPVSSAFHRRIQRSIQRENRLPKTPVLDLIASLKLKIAAPLVTAIAILVLFILKDPESQYPASVPLESTQNVTPARTQPALFSEARYRMGMIEGTDTLNEMLEEDIAGTQLATPGFGFQRQDFVQRLLNEDSENNLNF